MSYEGLTELPTPYTSPDGPGFVTQALTDNTPGMVHPLNSGDTVSVKFKGSYWTINIGYPQLTIAEGNKIIPFLYSLQGAFTNFYVSLPNSLYPAAGEFAAGANTQMGDSINKVEVLGRTSGLTAGDFIKFTGINKVYFISHVETTVTSMILTLNCDITDTSAVNAGEVEEMSEAQPLKFRVRIKGKTPTLSLNADGLYEAFSIELRENTL